jgi:hypothetical protein
MCDTVYLMRYAWLILLPAAAMAATAPVDVSAVRPGPVRVESGPGSVAAAWQDAGKHAWRAEFSLDPAKPLLTALTRDGRAVIERANPVYRAATGKRRGGWDQFFDFPPSHPDGTRQFEGVFKLTAARAESDGDRVRLVFAGLRMGIFTGSIAYTFFPGSQLIQQEAVVSTNEPDTAFYYDAGISFNAEADRRPGVNMSTEVAYFDTEGVLRKVASAGSERQIAYVRHRAIAARTAGGSLAVFPAPHQYFFARDFTSNMGHAWHRTWRGEVGLGVRQLPDDNSRFYPWMNAPPGTEQRLSLFLLPDGGAEEAALALVLRYTNHDRYPALPGYKTVAPHWHEAYTVQAMANGLAWTPPFKPVLKEMGVDAAIIMEFHGDGHPADTGAVRLQELDAMFRACRAQTDPQFLLIPAEEANSHLGGHWSVVFPKPVYWKMSRPAGTAFSAKDPQYGTVYSVGNAQEMLDLVRRENGWMYQTHPRTKGSTGFPDQIRDTAHFRDPRYLGAGWKAMPSDLSSPRLGERSLKLLDDMSNWGMKKLIMGEVDVFQLDHTHELWAHMNINYVKLPALPDFDHYGTLLEAMARGDFFVSTGEVLLPQASITVGADSVRVKAAVRHNFPLRLVEVVWGDGSQTHRAVLPAGETREFNELAVEQSIPAKGAKWARLAVWDVAGNGAFTNPSWK